ncbi:threonine--tRNA ligase [Candidatus Aerophobetes bacterium]|uniref:Threonine--tRNA ligase n=1 Tax=Aerophobetes bacterium TaxID=2030807 RepID=A0A2A4X496_UNCAE|nr:MAG: threonine--tRNA ligase [Candidatus Aerophobetes bacterium]
MKVKVDQEILEVEAGATAGQIAHLLKKTMPHQAVGVKINGQSCDFTQLLKEGDEICFFDFDKSEGKEVFWHTSAHILAQAVLRLFKGVKPTIGPPIENGFYYDFAGLTLSDNDLPRIEKEMKKIINENFKPERVEFKNKKEAIEAFKDNSYKVELIESFEENSIFSAYKQGEFFDLCKGPHLQNLGKVKALKLLKISGSYWRGDAKGDALTRIYGVSFPSKDLLKEHLHRLEEAKKRDHRVIGTALNLYSFKEEAPGMAFIHPHGMRIWDKLTEFWRNLHQRNNYGVILTPQLMVQELWETSGHWQHYKENMFTSTAHHDKVYAIKPMNCPGCMLYYKGESHSYRDLPLRIAEFGHVHRQEPSGALNGLFRVQSFHQDDAHIFMRKCQIKDEILEVLDLVKEIYETFDLEYSFELSTKPEKAIGSDEDWEITTQGLREALDAWGADYQVNEGDGAFYGPKIDLHVKDAIGRSWQCGTVQLDMSLPEKFNLTYKESDGSMQRPIMIHRAIFGSMERFLAILVEHYAGRFPLWLSPRPFALLPVSKTHIEYAEKLAKQIEAQGFFVSIDKSDDSVSKKVRTAQKKQFNYMLVLGDKEMEEGCVSVRKRTGEMINLIPVDTFLKTVENENSSKSAESLFKNKVEA